jgi:ATP-independent RNA helicase DbpA
MKNNTDFNSLALSKPMVKNLTSLGFDAMTPVQAESLPFILQGEDVIGQAKTGSGKTAAFGIGILERLNMDVRPVQALVLCPTRELAEQVAGELRRIAAFKANIKILTLCGGVPFKPQKESLTHHAHIVVGTPGRVLKHLDNKNLNLKNCQTLVLDEGDRMLDMGFIDQIRDVIKCVPGKRQTMLFSATFPEEINKLCASVQRNAKFIKTIETEDPNNIEEIFYEIETDEKQGALLKLFSLYRPENVLIFCEMKSQTVDITKALVKKGVSALAINGDLEQYQRTDVLTRFTNGSCRCLVATDVAARGLDIKELSLVINFTLPHDAELYTHRIGRTARAGHSGIAVTFYTPYQAQRISEYKTDGVKFEKSSSLRQGEFFDMYSLFQTVVIEGGKKNKIRAGDILGAFTGDAGLAGNSIGKINIKDKQSYVAVERAVLQEKFSKIKAAKIKGKKFPIWLLENEK